jgi:hypothetical protein
MPAKRSSVETEASADRSPTLASTVAPEDLKCGDYVAALNVVHEFPSFFWCCDAAGVSPHEPVRMLFRVPDAGTPLRIKAICLPFVFVKPPRLPAVTLDVRQVQLVRLNRGYAHVVWNELRKQKTGQRIEF